MTKTNEKKNNNKINQKAATNKKIIRNTKEIQTSRNVHKRNETKQ